ncbi:MAG TPA: hypothetical protein VK966_07680, partial [Longimicrobiales bacterium]|nr:hypothetical protein [Longimicrobiales bacterium]
RLPPMLNGDRAHIEMVYSLLFSLPGVPVLRYGEEIGMGDDASVPGRMSVRTPMQWSSDPNAGFSSAPTEHLVRPVITGGQFGYEAVNVDVQRSDPDSLLNFTARLIRTRKECPEVAFGATTILDTGDPAVFAQRSEWEGGVVVTVHNLSAEARTVSLPLDGDAWGSAVELFGSEPYAVLEPGRPELRLSPYGYRWLRLRPRVGAPDESSPEAGQSEAGASEVGAPDEGAPDGDPPDGGAPVAGRAAAP